MALFMRGVLQGVAHLHEKDVIHRDLKPGNILVGSYRDFSKVQIIDFGLAMSLRGADRPTGEVGTFLYMAPEQAAEGYEYGKGADIWACGIIMYELLCGEHPILKQFERKQKGKSSQDVKRAFADELLSIRSFTYSALFSNYAEHLISMLCQPKTGQRYTASQALQHPWITRDFSRPIPKTMLEVLEESKLTDILSEV